MSSSGLRVTIEVKMRPQVHTLMSANRFRPAKKDERVGANVWTGMCLATMRLNVARRWADYRLDEGHSAIQWVSTLVT